MLLDRAATGRRMRQEIATAHGALSAEALPVLA